MYGHHPRWRWPAFPKSRLLIGLAAALAVAAVTAPVALAVTVTGSITSSSPTETGTILLNGVTSSCDSPKAFPGVQAADLQLGYDAHTFSNTSASPQCVSVTEDPETCGSDVTSAAYTSFDPSDISKNYLGDLGSGFVTQATFSFTVPALSSFEVVEMSDQGPGVECSSYSLDVNGTGIIAGNLPLYVFNGLAAPVSNTGINTAKAGRTIPLAWRLTTADGSPVTDLTSLSVTVSSLPCAAGTSADLAAESASGDSGLQNLGNGYYQYNWKTPKSYADSCKTLHLDVGDGVDHTASFQFTK